MQVKSLSSVTSRCSALMLAGMGFYWLLVMHIGWSNQGGWGTDLPMNLLAWSAFSLLCAVCWGSYQGAVRWGGTTSTLMFAGALLMTLPLCWSPSEATLWNAMPRVAGIWAGLAFWFTLAQCRFSAGQRQTLLCFLVAAGAVEAIIVLLELYGYVQWLPGVWQKLIAKYGRGGVSVFQQVNVAASFLAMSLTASLLLLGLKSATLAGEKRESLRRGLLMGSIVLLSAVLTLLYSRTGWLGGLLVIAGINVIFRSRRFRSQAQLQNWLLLLPVVGVLLGLMLMRLSVLQALEAHDGSNSQRLLTLHYTLLYALKHPLIGYGAGTYHGLYQAFMAAQPGGNPGAEEMTHPHNELLFQYAEGGVIALAGALLWCYAWLRKSVRVTTPLAAGALLSMLPILLHTQLEYPLYYSVPHWLVLLTLLKCAQEEGAAKADIKPRRRRDGLIRAAMIALACYGAVLSWHAWSVGQQLGHFEANELHNPDAIATLDMPWIFRLRYQQDLTQLRLVHFRQNPDPLLLRAYVKENAQWIAVNPDPTLLKNQIAVLKYLKETEQADAWKKKSQRMYPFVRMHD